MSNRKSYRKLFRRVLTGGTGLPSEGLIGKWLVSNNLVDTIGLSISDAPNIRAEFWSIFFALDGEGQPVSLLDAATIIANMQASIYLNNGWELGGNASKGYFLYIIGTAEAVLRRAYSWAGEVYSPPVIPAWTKRKPITLTNSGSVITDYQQLVTIAYDSDMQADFSDIRFRASDGTTDLSFWLESKTDGVSATFYIKVPTVLGSGDTTIYCYYGNAAATDSSSISDTFLFAEDFEQPIGGSFANNNPLTTPTYDGGGNAVHPSVLYFPNGWNGHKYWMVFTPHGDNFTGYLIENPSMLVSDDGEFWSVPSGLTNPIVPLPSEGVGGSHNFDPYQLYHESTDEIWIYYMDRVGSTQTVWLIKSSDGISWSVPLSLMQFDTGTISYVSPSVVKIGSTYYLWLQNATVSTSLKRWTSTDGVTWTDETATSGIARAWHLNITYISEKSKYIALVAEYTTGKDLIIYTSDNGLTFTPCSNTAIMNRLDAWDRLIYQSSMVYYPTTDTVKIWYSALNEAFEYHISVTDEVPYAYAMTTAGTWGRIQGVGIYGRSRTSRRGGYSFNLEQYLGATMLVRHVNECLVGADIILSADFYDDLDSPNVVAFRAYSGGGNKVGIGVYTSGSTTKFAYHNKTFEWTVTTIDRSLGWHKFSIVIKSDSSVIFLIDDTQVGTLSSQFNNPINVEVVGSNYVGGAFIDDIRVQKYVSTVPTIAFGAEEAV